MPIKNYRYAKNKCRMSWFYNKVTKKQQIFTNILISNSF